MLKFTKKFIDIASSIFMDRIGESTYKTVQDMQTIFHSTGWVSGGGITDNGDLTVTIAAGTGFIRSTNLPTSLLYFFDWSALANQAIPSESIRYFGVAYNSGSPVVTMETSDIWDGNTGFLLGVVVRDASELHINTVKPSVGDHARNMIDRMNDTMMVERDEMTGGLILGETGTRNITMSAGALWMGLDRYSLNAVNTSTTGNFDRYYRNGAGGWTKQNNQTQWNNTQYDNGTGTLATMSAAKYSVQYFWTELDGDLVSLFGQAEYSTVAQALDDAVPSSLPNRLSTGHSKLIGRIIFQKSASTTTQIDSAFTTAFEIAAVTNHANLTNLDAASAGHTGFPTLAGTNIFTGTTNYFGNTPDYAGITSTGVLSFAGAGGYSVPSDKYAFYNGNYGLFFNGTSLFYEFRDTTAAPLFKMKASTGDLVSNATKAMAKAQVIDSVYNIVADPANIRGLWFWDRIDGETTLTDRGTLAHTMDLSAAISGLTPDQTGLCQHATFTTSSWYDTVDHADFSFGNGATDSPFSIVSLSNFTDATSCSIFSKYDLTTAATKQEYVFFTDSADKLNFGMYDDSSGGVISRKYNTALTADQGTFATYAGTYSGSALSTGIKIYRNAVQVDDTTGAGGVYTAMEDKTAKAGSYQTDAAGLKTRHFKGKQGVLLVVAEELTATQIKRLDVVFRGYARDLL